MNNNDKWVETGERGLCVLLFFDGGTTKIENNPAPHDLHQALHQMQKVSCPIRSEVESKGVEFGVVDGIEQF